MEWPYLINIIKKEDINERYSMSNKLIANTSIYLVEARSFCSFSVIMQECVKTFVLMYTYTEHDMIYKLRKFCSPPNNIL